MNWRERFYLRGRSLYSLHHTRLPMSFLERMYLRFWSWVYDRPLL